MNFKDLFYNQVQLNYILAVNLIFFNDFFQTNMSRNEGGSQENGSDGGGGGSRTGGDGSTQAQFECRLLIPSKMAGSIIGTIFPTAFFSSHGMQDHVDSDLVGSAFIWLPGSASTNAGQITYF